MPSSKARIGAGLLVPRNARDRRAAHNDKATAMPCYIRTYYAFPSLTLTPIYTESQMSSEHSVYVSRKP